jgi:polyribonucleotide nucleotidyltransferase
MEYEKENGNSISFTVTTKSLARIVGKAGAQINEIKDETMTTIDIDQQEDDSPTAIVSVRGTKAGIKKAQALIMAIAKEVDDETTLTVEIPKSFHTTLIGAGGANSESLLTIV